jgi:hypothetical protein
MSEVARKLLTINNPIHVLCEGSSDKGFLEHLIEHRGLHGFDVGCPTPETSGGYGVSGFQKYLLAIETSSDRARLRGLLVVADGDENPARRFEEIHSALAAIDCDVNQPFALSRIESKALTIAVFLVPGRDRTGTLEHLLLDAVFEGRPELKRCVSSFQDCLDEPGGWSDNKQAKMQLHALIAGCCEEEPSTNLATLWNKRGNPIPLASARFNELVETLRYFAAL